MRVFLNLILFVKFKKKIRVTVESPYRLIDSLVGTHGIAESKRFISEFVQFLISVIFERPKKSD